MILQECLIFMFLDRFSFKDNDLEFRKFNLLLVIVSMSLFLLNTFYLKSFGDFFKFYFNDLFAVIILIGSFNVVFPKKLNNVWIIFIITCFAAFFWEYVALFIKTGSVFDYLDILAYFVSMILYLILIYVFEGELNVSI